MSAAPETLPRTSKAHDNELIELVRAGDTDQFAILIRRYNQRLYRVARSITRDENEAEDVTQQAFLSAFQNLAQFAGRAQFSSWITRIAVNEAFARTKKKRRYVALAAEQEAHAERQDGEAVSPEHDAIRGEARGILERALDELAAHHRTVFVLRDVEELTTAETAAALDITEEAVRTRLHRARAALRELLLDRFGLAAADVFPFAGARCDRIVAYVFGRLGT